MPAAPCSVCDCRVEAHEQESVLMTPLRLVWSKWAGKRTRLFTLWSYLLPNMLGEVRHQRDARGSAERGLGRRQVRDLDDEAVILEALDAGLADGRQQVRKADGAELVQRQVARRGRAPRGTRRASAAGGGGMR